MTFPPNQKKILANEMKDWLIRLASDATLLPVVTKVLQQTLSLLAEPNSDALANFVKIITTSTVMLTLNLLLIVTYSLNLCLYYYLFNTRKR